MRTAPEANDWPYTSSPTSFVPSETTRYIVELASDLTFDRTAILSELLKHHHDWTTYLEEHRRKLADHARG